MSGSYSDWSVIKVGFVVADALGTLPQIILLTWGYTKIVDLRHPRRFLLVDTCIILAIHIGGIYIYPLPLLLKMVLSIGSSLGVMILFTKESLQKTLLLGALLQLIPLFSEVLWYVIWLMFKPSDGFIAVIANQDIKSLIMGKLSYFCCYAPMFVLFLTVLKKKWRLGDSAGFSFPVGLILCSQMVLVAELSILQFYTTDDSAIFYLSSALNVGLCIASAVLLIRVVNKLKERHALEQAKLQMENRSRSRQDIIADLRRTCTRSASCVMI